jgi:acetylornithine deacetylase/succinyl-diaminopimelate desuccinylase-like protein
MKRFLQLSRIVPLATFALVACADAPPPLPAPPPPAPPQAVAPPPAIVVAPPPPAPPEPFALAYRHLLDAMVRVDTSHGNETAVLEPIAAKYRELGVPVQILESAPGRGNLVARLKGSGQKRPLLLLAHVDVVPVEGQPWTVPPFEVTEKDGFLWGRGVNDDKAMAAAIVTTTLELAKEKAPLSRDIIVALTAGEETGGGAGAHWLVENHKELLDAEVALNEGSGLELSDDGQKVRHANVAVSEKLFQTFKLVVAGKGGHSSMPPTDGDPVTTLARALEKIGTHRFPAHVLPEAKAAFAQQVDGSPPALALALRHGIASAPRLLAADDKIITTDRFLNAQVRTTCVATTLAAAPQDNILPTTAEAQVNCRILPGETRDAVLATLKATVADPQVSIAFGALLGGGDVAPMSPEIEAAVKKVVAARFPGADVAPSMVTGATDSRYLRLLGIKAYGVSPVALARPELSHFAHGPDERAPVRWFTEGGLYVKDVIRALAL